MPCREGLRALVWTWDFGPGGQDGVPLATTMQWRGREFGAQDAPIMRSLFFAFFLRLAIAMGLVFAIRAWLVPSGWVLETLLVLAWASVSAWLLVRSIQHSIAPLQSSAAMLATRRARQGVDAAKGPGALAANGSGALAANLVQGIRDQRYSDFDGLARALAHASREIEHALSAASASRDELVAMIDSLHDAVVAVDPAGRIQWTNQRMQRLTTNDVLSPTPVARVGQALVHTVRDPEVLACVRGALEERVFRQGRSTSLTPGRIFEVNASPMPSGGAVALLRDVTRIEQVERTQREFVANVSHELRTPLTSITGYVETLLDHEESLSAPGRAFLGTILKNATRMNRLTEDLLTMARVESSEQSLQPVPLVAEALVREAVQAMSGLVQDTSAVLEIGPETTNREVIADHDATIQVLSNLIENAIKYGRTQDTGEARVVVSAREVQAPLPAVEFSVRDFGTGIASEHVDRIFERFYRVDKARSLESGGTGLGLAIARHIVESQGGAIRVDSELNAGSEFVVTLPALDRPASENGS